MIDFLHIIIVHIIISGVTHPTFCVAVDINNGFAGHQSSFLIQARDGLGMNRTTGGDTFCVLLHGPAFVEATVKDNQDGTYTVKYLPQVKVTLLLLLFINH